MARCSRSAAVKQNPGQRQIYKPRSGRGGMAIKTRKPRHGSVHILKHDMALRQQLSLFLSLWALAARPGTGGQCAPRTAAWPAPAAQSVADRRSTNKSVCQTRKPTEPRREIVLLAASATVIVAWSSAASFCRILPCVRRARTQTGGDAPLSLHTRCTQALTRSAPNAYTNIVKRAGFPHHVLVRCMLVVFRQTAVPHLSRSALEMQPQKKGRMALKWSSACSLRSLCARTSRARRVGLI